MTMFDAAMPDAGAGGAAIGWTRGGQVWKADRRDAEEIFSAQPNKVQSHRAGGRPPCRAIRKLICAFHQDFQDLHAAIRNYQASFNESGKTSATNREIGTKFMMGYVGHLHTSYQEANLTNDAELEAKLLDMRLTADLVARVFIGEAKPNLLAWYHNRADGTGEEDYRQACQIAANNQNPFSHSQFWFHCGRLAAIGNIEWLYAVLNTAYENGSKAQHATDEYKAVWKVTSRMNMYWQKKWPFTMFGEQTNGTIDVNLSTVQKEARELIGEHPSHPISKYVLGIWAMQKSEGATGVLMELCQDDYFLHMAASWCWGCWLSSNTYSLKPHVMNILRDGGHLEDEGEWNLAMWISICQQEVEKFIEHMETNKMDVWFRFHIIDLLYYTGNLPNTMSRTPHLIEYVETLVSWTPMFATIADSYVFEVHLDSPEKKSALFDLGVQNRVASSYCDREALEVLGKIQTSGRIELIYELAVQRATACKRFNESAALFWLSLADSFNGVVPHLVSNWLNEHEDPLPLFLPKDEYVTSPAGSFPVVGLPFMADPHVFQSGLFRFYAMYADAIQMTRKFEQLGPMTTQRASELAMTYFQILDFGSIPDKALSDIFSRLSDALEKADVKGDEPQRILGLVRAMSADPFKRANVSKETLDRLQHRLSKLVAKNILAVKRQTQGPPQVASPARDLGRMQTFMSSNSSGALMLM